MLFAKQMSSYTRIQLSERESLISVPLIHHSHNVKPLSGNSKKTPRLTCDRDSRYPTPDFRHVFGPSNRRAEPRPDKRHSNLSPRAAPTDPLLSRSQCTTSTFIARFLHLYLSFSSQSRRYHLFVLRTPSDDLRLSGARNWTTSCPTLWVCRYPMRHGMVSAGPHMDCGTLADL
jgi:hypothetical protein